MLTGKAVLRGGPTPSDSRASVQFLATGSRGTGPVMALIVSGQPDRPSLGLWAVEPVQGWLAAETAGQMTQVLEIKGGRDYR